MGSIGITEIPIVDLSPFANGGDLASRQKAAKDFNDKVCLNGAVGITGYGVPSHVVDETFELAKKLFSLPLEDKMKAPHPKSMAPHRGYSGYYTERGGATFNMENDNPAYDYKETFEIGGEENYEQENIYYPEEVFPGFRETSLRLFSQLNKVGDVVLDALIMGLDLPEDDATNVREIYHGGRQNQMRMAYYPAITKEMLDSGPVSRVGAHTDWGFFTLTWQDKNGGLELYDRASEKFLPAVPKKDVVYLNLADMFERVSNGRYASGIHRVDASKITGGRYSLPLFTLGKFNEVIEPQKSLVAADGVRRFEPTTLMQYGEAKQRTYREGDWEE